MSTHNDEPPNVSNNHNSNTPLPLHIVIPLCCILFAEPMIFTIIFPFIFFMVRSFGVAEEQVGRYAGWIAASFSMAQFLTSYPIGRLSDRWGRRPILLLGLAGNIVCVICFGLSRSLTWAITSRVLCGLLNGNNGVAKSVLAEVTDDSNRALAFSLVSFLWNLGSMVGPVLGGLLADPVTQYPDSFLARVELFRSFPFLLPCLVSSVFSLFGLIMALFYLPETMNTESKNESQTLDIEPQTLDIESNTESHDNNSESNESAPLLSRPDDPKIDERIRICYNSIVAYCLLAFSSTLFVELYPLWTATDPGLGGLGFQAREIGVSIAIIAVISMIFQITLYPPLESRFSALGLFQCSLAICTFAHPLLPLLHRLLSDPWLLWILLMLVLGIRSCATGVAFTAAMIMINSSAPPNALGSMNGVAQMAVSAVRSFAPPLCGSLFAWSLNTSHSFPIDYNLVFLLISASFAGAFVWSRLQTLQVVAASAL